MVNERCSVVYDEGEEGRTDAWAGIEASVDGSHRSVTPEESNAWATAGQMVLRSDWWTMSVSAALHAEG
jgi:hypothetical protein